MNPTAPDPAANTAAASAPDHPSERPTQAQLTWSRLITDNIPLGLYVYHLEDVADDRTLRMVYANPAVTALTGLSPQDVVGKTLDENFPGLRAKGIPQRFAEVVRRQASIQFDDMVYGDDRLPLASFSVSAFPLTDNLVGIAFDNITERKEMALLKFKWVGFSVFTKLELTNERETV